MVLGHFPPDISHLVVQPPNPPPWLDISPWTLPPMWGQVTQIPHVIKHMIGMGGNIQGVMFMGGDVQGGLVCRDLTRGVMSRGRYS